MGISEGWDRGYCSLWGGAEGQEKGDCGGFGVSMVG